MTAAVALLACLVGILIGVVALDMIQRFGDRKMMKDAEKSFLFSQQQLSELHNSSTQNLKDLADKVSALEMAIKSPTQPTPIKRF